MIDTDMDVTGVAKRATDALQGNSLIKVAQSFADQPASALGDVANRYGFTAAADALKSGRLDDLVGAVGNDAIGLLAKEGGRRLNKAIDKIAGKLGPLFQAFDRSDPPPAGSVMLVLGDFAFMVGTLAHQTLKRTHEYRWARQDRILRTPARQFVGPGDERIDLDGYLLPHYTGGADALNTLRQRAALGQPQELVDHYGAVYGRYVVETIEETGSELDPHGQARRVDFRVALAIYGEDSTTAIGQAATAVADNASTPQTPAGSKASIDNGWAA